MDCDDVLLHLAAHGPTLDGREQGGFDRHLESCESCRAMTLEAATGELRPIARIADDAFDDPNSITLPVIEAFVFQIDKRIAAGGMGQVLRAFDKRLGREVALKEMLDPRDRPRFEREVAITARLQHPAIVPIYEAGTWPDGTAFYAMRLVDGGTLSHAIENATTFAERIALLPHVVAATEALGYAHSRRVIHRDLKPSNVLVGGFGETVVIDWGLAKELDRPDIEAPDAGPSAPHHDLTHAGTIMGTPCFMAPEQARGEPLDETADVYALGAMLYHLVSGSPPYWDTYSTEPHVILDITRLRPPTALADLAPDAPADLRAIIERAMARARSERYPTAREMAQELRRFEAGQLIARPYTFGELARRWIKKHRAAVAISTLAVVVLAVVAVFAFAEISRARTEAEDALVIAARDRDTANTQTAALLEERGRVELLAGNAPRAREFLSDAAKLGRDTPALRYLLGAASREPAPQQYALGKATAIAFTADGTLVTASGNQLVRWDGATQRDSKNLSIVLTEGRLSPDATRLYGASTLNATEEHVMFHVASGTPMWAKKLPTAIYQHVFDGAGSHSAMISWNPENLSRTAELYDAKGTATPLPLAGESVNQVAFSDDGDLVAACGEEGTVRVWRWNESIRTLEQNGERCDLLGYVGSSKLVVERGHVLSLWSHLDPAPTSINSSYTSSTALAVHRGRHRFAVGDQDGTVRVFSSDGELIGESRHAQRRITSLVFSSDGLALVGRAEEDRVFVWDMLSTPQLRVAIATPRGATIAIDPAAKRIATIADDGQASVWSLPRGPRIAHAVSSEMAILGDAWVTQDGQRFTIHRLDTGAEVRTAQTSTDQYRLTALLRAATSLDMFVSAVDAPREQGTVKGYALAGSGLIIELDVDKLRVTDAVTSAQKFELPIERGTRSADIDDAATRIVVATATQLQRYELATGVAAAPITLPKAYGRTVHLHGKGRIAAVYTTRERTVQLFDVDTNTLAGELTVGMGVDTVAFGGDLLFVWGDGTVQLWDWRAKKLRFTAPAATRAAFSLSFDGTLIATGTADGTVQIWDLATGVLLEQFRAASRSIQQVVFAGNRLAVQAADLASLWSIPQAASVK